MSNLNFLDEFGADFAPQSPTQLPVLDNIPDGDYDCTILSSILGKTKNSGQEIIRLEVLFESVNKVAEKVYFIKSQENINRLGGDFGTLGIDIGNWGKGKKLSEAIPESLRQLPGRRFKGTKKHNKVGEKTYHNLYINAPLDPAKNAADLRADNDNKQATEGHNGDCPF